MPGGYGNMDHFSPNIQYAEPGSPLVYPVSPTGGMSPIGGSRDSSRDPMIRIPDDRGRERSYHASRSNHASHLVVSSAGAQNLSRSNSERNRPPVYVSVAAEGRGRHGRSTSVGPQYYYDDAGKKHAYAGSVYSNSSFGSRGHSRSQSKARHSRSPSCGSCDSFEDHHHSNNQYSGAMAPYNPKKEDLSEQLRRVQLQLEQVHAETDKRKKEEENVKLEKLRTEEIERKVTEQLLLQRKKEADAAAAAKKKADDERARIEAEAQKLLDARAAKEKAAKEAEEADKKRIQAIIDQERAKYEALSQGRRTYTKFSKVHLCKEALDERNIAYTEEVSFNHPMFPNDNFTNTINY
ncbi:hypothetical protein Q9L58_007392 [Maublancomyces gigas]|uniref:Uncharacterized protein n=1 Tax=Discina gigas TaxID=1032678 RepID=A0ABR3GCY8_9PEZI